jgi:predicted acylesterase/phospholipase RssA
MATEPDGGLGLTLSGGGFRATLYHLGVVRFLYDAGALARVRRICSVSGGSILAAHLVLNWGRYTGSTADFDGAAKELLDLVRSDLRGRVVRRWLFGLLSFLRWLTGGRLTRIWLLEREYERLYGKKQLKDLKGGPELYMLTTSMTTGDLCCFTSDGLAIDSGGVDKTFLQPQLPIALAVAASSAFPPFFPPVPVTRELLHRAVGEFSNDHYLADGGVFDNLGINKMQRLQGAKPLPLGHVLVSDAQGPFDWALNSRYGLLPKRATRTSDILMKRVSDLEYEHIKRHAGEDGCRYVRCCLQDEVPGDAMPPALQYDSRTIRTDLDPFSPVEIEVLVRRGYTTARQACQRHPELTAAAPPTARPWAPPAPAGVAEAVDNGTVDLGPSVKLRLRLWSPRDGASWASLATALAFVGALAALLLTPYFFKHRQTTQLQEEKTQLQEELKELQNAGNRLRPGSLVQVGQRQAAICCVVITNSSRRCFLTSNHPFEFEKSKPGDPVTFGPDAAGLGRGQEVVGFLDRYSEVDFSRPSPPGGALVLASSALVTAKLPNGRALRRTAQPSVGQKVRVINGNSVLSGTVANMPTPADMNFLGKVAKVTDLFRIDLDLPGVLAEKIDVGLPVLAAGPDDLIAMVCANTPEYLVATPIEPLFRRMGVDRLADD